MGLLDQFLRLRDGDPFLNDPDLAHRMNNIIDLSDITLRQVIRWNSRTRKLPRNMF